MILNLKILVLCYAISVVAGAPSAQLQDSKKQEDALQQRMNEEIAEDNADDDYSASGESSASGTDLEEPGAQKHGINANQQKEILELHNQLRRKEAAANMHKVHWNKILADLAQTWSERCVFEHGQPPHDDSELGYSFIGQNIFAQSASAFSVNNTVQGWYDEKPDFRYDFLQCKPGKVCGHYTAVTWSDTKEVGCGMAFCPSLSGMTNARFVVCNYGPPGNWAGQKPYNKGSECSKCSSGKFYCNNGLCDHTCTTEGPNCHCAANCQNNGVKTADCGCKCKPGFMGVDCSDPCKDLNSLCGANPGYPIIFCASADPKWSFVKDICPKMCRKCR